MAKRKFHVFYCPECQGSGAQEPEMLPCGFCYGSGEVDVNSMRKTGLVDWLVAWREKHKGSISPENNRENLKTRSEEELRSQIVRILENEQRAEKK